MLILAASIFFTQPAPLEMPRAESYLVKEDGRYRLEDRYNRLDLWISQAIDGRWIDEDGRVFTLARLETSAPEAEADGMETRVRFAEASARLEKKDVRSLRQAIEILSPVEVAEKAEPPRQLPRGYDDVDYWQGTNTSVIVCAFRPEKSPVWRLAVWELAEGDVFEDRLKSVEDDFLVKEFRRLSLYSEPILAARRKLSERELLRLDAHHSVTNYAGWSCTDSDEFTILHTLPKESAFIVSLTNDIKVMRRRYSEVLPTAVDVTNVLCVARVFGSRDDYLDWADDGMEWTAAYWDPRRREIVAYLPADGEKDLLKTLRHEAFHQYLNYACSMISASPWLNEGYAQFFEDEALLAWDVGLDPEQAALLIPPLLTMDYDAFYDGSDIERKVKYRLARSLAVFIEKGADKVRHQPFKTLKKDYLDALVETHDMKKATAAAFRNADRLQLFVSEWKRFWQNTSAD